MNNLTVYITYFSPGPSLTKNNRQDFTTPWNNHQGIHPVVELNNLIGSNYFRAMYSIEQAVHAGARRGTLRWADNGRGLPALFWKIQTQEAK